MQVRFDLLGQWPINMMLIHGWIVVAVTHALRCNPELFNIQANRHGQGDRLIGNQTDY